MKQILFNPFNRIAGAKALMYGLPVLLLTAAIAYRSNFHMDALLHMGAGAQAPFVSYVLEALVVWACTVFFFFLIGSLFSKSRVRFLDIAGTTVLARWPFVFIAVLSFIPVTDNKEAVLKGDITALLPLLLMVLLSLPFILLFIVLLYNAYVVSTNLKGSKAVWSFILAILLSDVLSRIVFHFFVCI